MLQLFHVHHVLQPEQRSELCKNLECPYRGEALMKVIKVDSSNDQGADFQPINFKEVFQELKASVEGRDKKKIVKQIESFKIIDADDTKTSL